MRLKERLIWALLIVIVDTAAFVVPLAAFPLAHVVLALPRWFRVWVERLYREAPRLPVAAQDQDPRPGPDLRQ